MVLEFGDGWLLGSLIAAKGGVKEGFKLDIGVVRRAESYRNSNDAAIFYGYLYFTFYLEEIFYAHLFPFFFFVIRNS